MNAKKSAKMITLEGSGPALPIEHRARRRGGLFLLLWAYRFFFLCVGLPTGLTTFYEFGIASDRYVSEAQFIVHRVSDNPQANGLMAILKATGIAGGADEINAVQAYIRSRDAVRDLETRVPLKQIYGRDPVDRWARWPSVFYGNTEEELYRYYTAMMDVAPSQETSVMTLQVSAFQPKDAQVIAETLLQLSEAMVNRMNDRTRTDSLRSANDEVIRSEAQLEKAQTALVLFRNQELMLDPEKSAILQTELIGTLNSQLAEVRAQILQLKQTAQDSPQMTALQSQADVIEKQIEAQRRAVAGDGTNLATKIAQYDRLQLEKDVAAKRLAGSIAALTLAQADARRQQLFLQRIVDPNLPDRAMLPRRTANVLTVLGWSCLIYLIIWLLAAGIREHAAENQ